MKLERGSGRLAGSLETAVEVEIWSGYLLRNRTNLIKTLCTYSLDNGPRRECDGGRLLFTFTRYDWDRHIAGMLDAGAIHYTVTRTMKTDVLQQLLKKKIFVAEDDPDILSTVSAVLINAGYHVRQASCGQPVIDGNYSWVDLFILDNRMPDVDGIDICRHLRSHPATKDTPVILISAYPETAEAALKAGVSAYIGKPFQLHYLLNMVARYTRVSAADNSHSI